MKMLHFLLPSWVVGAATTQIPSPSLEFSPPKMTVLRSHLSTVVSLTDLQAGNRGPEFIRSLYYYKYLKQLWTSKTHDKEHSTHFLTCLVTASHPYQVWYKCVLNYYKLCKLFSVSDYHLWKSRKRSILHTKLPLVQFCLIRKIVHNFLKEAIKVFFPFPTTYLCEAELSSYTSNKRNYSNRLNVEAYMRIQLISSY